MSNRGKKSYKVCLWTASRDYTSRGYSKVQGSQLRDSLALTGFGATRNDWRFISLSDGESQINQRCSCSRGRNYL